MPKNNSLVEEHHEAFDKTIQAEFDKGRYIGLLSRAEIKELISPLQTPLSIIPKPGKPGKY
jgi:hypothetical protein